MKKVILLFFVCILFAVGCAPAVTVLPSATNISVYPSPSATATKELSTPNASATLAVTPVPALSINDARARLLELLANNGNCHLPCLWGITPGKNSFRQAQIILAPLSSISHSVYLDTSGSGSIMPRYTEVALEIYTRVAFLTNPDNDVVNRVTFNAEAHRPLAQGGYEDIFDSKFFGEMVSTYTLPYVLTEQGVPSSVMIATFGGPLTRGGSGGFDILLLYPDQGILVNYTTQMHLIGTNVRGCFVNAYVEMELYPSGQDDSFFVLLQQTDWSIKLNYYKPLEKVTTMSLDEFYQIFHEPTDQCIETPANLWVIPEP